MPISVSCRQAVRLFALLGFSKRLLAVFLLASASGFAIGAQAAGNAVGTMPGDFSVDKEGAAVYHVSITLPPGVHGLKPDLSLSYSSHGGKDISGVGWALSGVSVITRCAQTLVLNGINHSPNLTTDDRFCLDGERLISLPGGVYQTEIYNGKQATPGATVAAGPCQLGNGPATFTVVDRSGLTSTYGDTPDSTLVGNGYSTGVPTGVTWCTNPSRLEWPITRTTDAYGNFVSYKYYNDQADPTSDPADVYIKEIDYGSSSGIVARVMFTYGAANVPTSGILGFNATVFINSAPAILAGIQVTDGSGAVLRTYTLKYASTSPTQLTSMQECGSDGSCFAPTTFSYQGTPSGFSGQPVALSDNVMPMKKVLDLDGDGLPDYVFCPGDCSKDEGEIYVVFGSKINGHSIDTGMALDSGNFKINFQNAVVVSMYGDGKQQLLIPYYPVVSVDGGGVYWKLFGWNGSKTNPQLIWLGDPPLTTRQTLPATGYGNALGIDLTGTGRTDLVFSYQNTLWYYHNTANGFDTANGPVNTGIAVNGQPRLIPVNYSGTGVAEMYVKGVGIVEAKVTGGPTLQNLIVEQNELDTAFAQDYTVDNALFFDADGDGLTSVVLPAASGNAWCFFPNTGSGWDFHITTPNCTGVLDLSGAPDAQVVDWYGDGRQEVVYPLGGGWRILQTGVSGPTEDSLYIISANLNLFTQGDGNSGSFMDVDGDGEPDMLYTSGGNTYFIHNDASPYLLNQITNGQGMNTDVSYVPLSLAQYTSAVVNPDPPTLNAPEVVAYTGPMMVVRDFAVDTGLLSGGTPAQLYTYYKYTGAAVDQWGRGMLGFTEVESINSNSGLFTINHFNQTFPYQGMVMESDQYWNPSITSPQPANVGSGGGGWKTRCTIAANGEPDCTVPNQPQLEPVNFDTGTLIKKTLTTPASISPYANVTFPYAGTTVVSNYELGASQPFMTAQTDSHYAVVASGTTVGRDVEPDTRTVTVIDSANPSVDKSIEVTTTAYDPTNETACPGRPSSVAITDTFDEPTPATYPAKVESFTYDGNCAMLTDVKTISAPPGSSASGYPMDIESDYVTDGYGNTQKITVLGTLMASRVTSMAFDITQRFPVSTTNPLGQVSSASYDAWGNKLTETDLNGNTITHQYDGLNRLVKLSGPAPSVYTTWTYGPCSGSDCVSGIAASQVIQTGTDLSYSKTQYDAQARVIRAEKSGFGNSTVYQDTVYDLFGRVMAVSKPYYSMAAASSCWDFNTYDVLGRLTKGDRATQQGVCAGPAADNDDSHVTNTYSGLTTTSKAATTNNTGVSSESSTIVRNVLGKPDSVTDALGNKNSYLYDPWGNAVSITPPDGKTVSLVLDSEGHKLSLQDPDVGSWVYSNDAMGDVLTQTDSSGQTQTNTYDQMGRLVQRQEAEGTSKWIYDIGYGGGVGKLAYKVAANGAWEGYAYDVYGHATDKITILNGQEYWVTNTFDNQGRISQVVYPDMNGITFSGTPVTPSQFAVAADPANVGIFDLTWNLDAHTGVIYHAYRTAVATGQAVEVYAGPDTGAVDDGITTDGQYTWTLQACDGSTNCSSSASVSLNVVLPPTIPGMPAPGNSPVQTTTHWPISWAASTLGITGTACPLTYVLQQSTDNGVTFTQVGQPISQACGSNPSIVTATVGGGDGTYLYRVKACGAGGTVCSAFSPVSPPDQVYIQPGALPNFSVPATAYNNSPAVVSFSLPVPSVTGGALTYTIEKSDGSTNKFGLPIYTFLATSTTSTFTYNETQDGVYTYRVTACNTNNSNLCTASVVSQNSTSVTLSPTTAGGPVHVPGVDSHASSWEITWPSATLASGTDTISYNLYQLINGGSTNGGTTAYIGSNTLNWMYTPINNQDATYTYEIQACVTDPVSGGPSCTGRSGPGSGYATIITPDLPGPISMPGGVNMDGTFTASWTEDSTGAPIDSFIAASGWQDTPSDPIVWHPGGCTTGPGTHSCTFNTVAGNGNYFVRVEACDQGVCSSWRTSTSSVLGGGEPAPTITVPATTATGSATVSWTSVPGTDHYLLFTASYSGSWSAFTPTNMGTALTHAAHLSATITAGRYYVEACDAVPTCTAASATKTLTYVAPAAPTLSGSGTSSPFSLSWSAPAGATSYTVYQDSYNGTWSGYHASAVCTNITVRTCNATVGARATEVEFYVVACNAVDCSGSSNVLDFTINLCGLNCTSSTYRPEALEPEQPTPVQPMAPVQDLVASIVEPVAPPDSPALTPRVMAPPLDAAGMSGLTELSVALGKAELRQPDLQAVVLPERKAEVAAISPAPQGYGSRHAYMAAHRATAHAMVKAVAPAQQLADVAWPPRAVDPRLSLYPPLRDDKRVKQQFVSLGGVLPGGLQDVADTEPTPADAFMVLYQYTDPHGYLSDVEQLDSNGNPVRQLWVAAAMTPSDQVSQSVYDAPVGGGAGTVEIDDSYDIATGHLGGTQATAGTSGQTLGIQYDWDGYSNLKDRIVTQNGQQVLDESFIYDAMNRLGSTSTAAGGNSYSSSTGYDAVGDITSNGGFTGYSYVNPAITVGTYQYSQPHAVAQVTTPAGASRTYQYDNDGNLRYVYEGGTLTRQVDWYSFNKPQRITANGTTETFTYDGDYQRLVTSISVAGGTDTTTYIDGIFESENNSATQTQTYRQYLLVGAARIAVDTVTAVQGQAPAEQLGYFVRDPVGSVVGEVTENADQTSQKLALYSYDSWGKERPTSTVTGQTAFVSLPAGQFLSDTSGQNEGFGGHENQGVVGLVEMEGRVYDPEIGRFLSADPGVQFPLTTSGYNRYTYVNDNPLSLSDPSGFSIFDQLDPAMSELGKLTNIDDLAETMDDPGHTSRMWAMSKMSPQEFNVVNTVGSAFCFYAAAACYGLGQYEYERSQGAPADAALQAGAEAGAEYYIMHVFSPSKGPPSSPDWAIPMLKSQLETAGYQVATQMARDEMQRIANRNGMSLAQLDAYLEAVSFIGDAMFGSRNHVVDGKLDIVGFNHRGMIGKLGVGGWLFDVTDTLLEYQGIPSATGWDYIMHYRGIPINEAHSLGSLTANNLVYYGAAPSANLFALPFGMVATGGTNVQISCGDFVTGFCLGAVLNPETTFPNANPDGTFGPIEWGHDAQDVYNLQGPPWQHN